MKRQVADRIFLNAISFSVVAVAYFEPASVVHGMLNAGGIPAQVSFLALLFLSFLAMLDTIWNDVLPPHHVFEFGLGKRRGLWVLIASMYSILAFVAIHTGYGWSSFIFWLLVAVRSIGVSFLDLYYEYEPVVRDPSTPISNSIAGALGDV